MKFNINNKTFLKILSGLVALVLWFAITYTEDPVISQHLGELPIVFEGEKKLMDNGLVIVNKEKLPSISAVIRGKRSNVISAIGTVTASCDVSGVEAAGENSVEVKYNYPTSTITMARAKTSEITVETQKLITRSIPVKITQKNADKNTNFIVKSVCEVSNLRIKGAETDVYSVSYASVEIDVSEMNSDNSQEYFYKLCDKDGAVVSENNIIYKSGDTVSVENTVYKKVSLPVNVKLSKDLENSQYLTVKSISTDKIDVGIIGEAVPESLIAEIKTVSGDAEYKLEIIPPEGIYLPETSRKITAVCEIVPLVKREMELKIEIANNQDKKFAISPEKIKVEIIYPEGVNVDDKIKASVDLKTAEAGDVLPVRIELPEKVSCEGNYTTEIYIK